MDEGLLSIIPAGCGQLVKMLITLEPHGIFRSNFTYLLYPLFSLEKGVYLFRTKVCPFVRLSVRPSVKFLVNASHP